THNRMERIVIKKPVSKKRQIRILKRKLNAANKTMGAQGETIYRQRCQIAELRALTSKEERAAMREWLDGDDRRNLVEICKNLHKHLASRHMIIQQLREQMRANARRAIIPSGVVGTTGPHINISPSRLSDVS